MLVADFGESLHESVQMLLWGIPSPADSERPVRLPFPKAKCSQDMRSLSRARATRGTAGNCEAGFIEADRPPLTAIAQFRSDEGDGVPKTGSGMT
jgi:hypothetical protein